jgi:hypothetical protein
LGREQEEVTRMAAMPSETGLAVSGRLHRNTLSRKLSDVMDRVGLDRTRLGHRAVLDLALQLEALPAPPPETDVPELCEVLEEPAARRWAAQLLAPLEELGPRHLGLLATWAEHNAHLGEVAEALDRHRNTITKGLADISAAISRQVSDVGRGQHDAYLALAIDPAGTGLLDTLPRFVIAPPGRGEPIRDGASSTMTDPAGTDADPQGNAEPPITGSASSARVYNAMGGGKDNYLPDEEIARRIFGLWPTVGQAVQANRTFIHRSARWLTQEVGIRQFLDLGCGIPTPNSPNLHEAVQQIAPASRVLYVDNDPTVLAHTSALLTSTPEGRTAYLDADATDPGRVLASRELADTLDLDQPVALFLCALLHLIPDHQNPKGIVEQLTEALAPGSYVVISHATPDYNPTLMDQVAEVYTGSGRVSAVGTHRSRAEIEHLLSDQLELVEPGIVPVHRWQPNTAATDVDLPDDAINCYALVARKA